MDYQHLQTPYHTILFEKLLLFVDLCTHHRPYHVENKPCLFRFGRCIWVSSVSLNFYILSLIFVNGPQALCVNTGCIICISGMNVSPANKKLPIITFVLYILSKNYQTIMVSCSKRFCLIPYWMNSLLASCSLRNLVFFYCTMQSSPKVLFSHY